MWRKLIQTVKPSSDLGHLDLLLTTASAPCFQLVQKGCFEVIVAATSQASMHSLDKPLENWRSLVDRKVLGCAVCFLMVGWGWLLCSQSEYVGLKTVKEALLSKRSLQVLKPPTRRSLQTAAATSAYDAGRSQPYDFQSTSNYQKILKYNESTFAHEVDEELLSRPFCGLLQASGPAQNPAEFKQGRWYKDHQGEFFWEANGCRLRR